MKGKNSSSSSVKNLVYFVVSAMIMMMMSQQPQDHVFHPQSPFSFISVVDAFFLLPPQSSSSTSSPSTGDRLGKITHFVPFSSSSTTTTTTTSAVHMAYYNSNNGRYNNNNQRSKRQERVGQLVQTELANILHRGHIQYLNNNDGNNNSADAYLEDDLRKRISIVNADVSPDLRRARITISILGRRGGGGGRDSNQRMIDKRRAYAWLVRNTKSIRHALSSKMAHMKGGSPELMFVQVDVGAAVDVMNLIDKVGRGYKREDVGDEEYWKSMMLEMEKGEEEEDGDDYDGDEDDDWIDEEGDDDDDDEEGGDEMEEDGTEEDGDFIDEDTVLVDADNNDNDTETVTKDVGDDAVDEEEDEWLDFDDEDK